MAPAKRKRTKSSTRHDEPISRPSKRQVASVTPIDDEDIPSDDDIINGTAPAFNVDPNPQEANVNAEQEENDDLTERAGETAEERRLRLARAYLRHVGVSEDAAVATVSRDVLGVDQDGMDSDGESGNDEDDDANALLRQNANLESGRAVEPLADTLKASLPSISSSSGVISRRGHVLPPTCVSLSSKDASRALSGGKDSRVIMWDVATQTRLHTFKPIIDKSRSTASNIRNAQGHIGPVHSVSLSDDGTTGISAGADGVIRIWDMRAKEGLAASLRGHRGAVYGVSLREGTPHLFSASADRTVRIWDVGERAYVETLFGHGGEVTGVAALPRERALSCGRDGTVRLYKVVEGSQLLFRSSSTMSVDCVSVLHEQRFISGGDDGSVCLWQLNKKRPTSVAAQAHGASLGCESWVSSVCALRNTDVAMSGGGDGHLRFWKCELVPKLVAVGSVDLGKGFVNGIAVSRDRRVMLAAVGNEHRLGRWARIGGGKNSIKFIALPRQDD